MKYQMSRSSVSLSLNSEEDMLKEEFNQATDAIQDADMDDINDSAFESFAPS